MNRQQKEACVAALSEAIAESAGTFVIGVKGLTVSQVQKLRTSLRKHEGKMQVVKNTLGLRALSQDESSQDLGRYCREQVALVFAQSNAIAVARVLSEYAKEHAQMQIVAGCVERRVIAQDAVVWLGSLPGREVLLAQVCGTLKSPIVAHVSVLKQLVARLACVMQQIHAQRSVSES